MWIFYALLSAFFVATTDPIAKKVLNGGGDAYLIGWFALALSVPFLAVLYFFHGVSTVNPSLVKTILCVLPFEILATIMYYRALDMTDISLSVPLLALTPVFSMLTAFVLLGERIRPSGFAGIALITAGVYSLNLKEARYGFIHPLKAIFLNKGSMYMAIVALIFSITSTVSKKAMLYSSPESIPFIYNSSIVVAMLPIILYRLTKKRSDGTGFGKTAVPYILLGIFSAFSSICYFKAVSLTNVAYAISIKRLSLFMSVGYGWLFFRERDIHIRLISTFCMFLGVVLIIIS